MTQLRNVVMFELGGDPAATGEAGGEPADAEPPAGTPAPAPAAAPARRPFAAELRWVREITTLGFVTFLPSAPLPICGVVNFHGAIVPVIDLAELLQRPSSGLPRQGDPALLVEVDHIVAAFRVDAIRHVATLPQPPAAGVAWQLPPAARSAPATSVAVSRTATAERLSTGFSEHVLDRDGAVVPLVDLPALLRRCAQLVSAAARAGAGGAS